ncbi:DUF2510 domain-containing protein [Tsukamurella pseudospumae]|uniref:DUF2510 domain-containing protein n=1 Tax=Tsukamurella pseudospumae TaxID=239498 RepID=A0A137ZZP7_9ACTN|nr:DUF2510 domain-containing protein [Tsukamurella pseudospumae]KXP03670.1 hypothetical protein AXK60_17875 [Tsukamurella pseudospumae]
MAGRMQVRASTEVGPVRVSVAPARGAKGRAKAGRTADPVPQRASTPQRFSTAQRAATAGRAVATGLRLPKKADLPPPVAPAGWYPDPEDRARMRWWNGEKWTRRFAEPGAVPVVARRSDAPPRLAARPRTVRTQGLLQNVGFSGTRGARRASSARRTRGSERSE